MVSVRGIQKTFAVRRGVVHALRGVDLDVPTGQLTAILGASGSGKTTLLRVIAGFERPDQGHVTLGERELVSDTVFVRPEGRGIGVVAQDGALFPHLDVAGNIGFGLDGASARLSRRAKRAREQRVAELLDLVGLPGYQRRRVDELSGGQQQRVALARALAPGPEVVALDEPFSALDAALRVDLAVEVRDLLARLGVTTMLVTHDQQEALSLADTVAVMRDGHVVQHGPPSAVYERPADHEVARFVGDAVILPGRVVAADVVGDVATNLRVECALGTLGAFAANPFRADDACHVVLRPEQVRLGAPGALGVAGRVTAVEYFGHDVVTRVRLGENGEGAQLRARSTAPCARVGEGVGIAISTPVFIVP